MEKENKLENKKEIVSWYFNGFIFNALESDKSNRPWVDGARLIIEDICANKNLSLQKLVDYFSFKGNKSDLKTFKSLDEDLNSVKNGKFYMPNSAPNTKLGYYQTLAEAVDLYLKNRDKELEKAFDAFIKNGVSVSTIEFCLYSFQSKKKSMTKRDCCIRLYELMMYLTSMDINSLLRQEVNKTKF